MFCVALLFPDTESNFPLLARVFKTQGTMEVQILPKNHKEICLFSKVELSKTLTSKDVLEGNENTLTTIWIIIGLHILAFANLYF
jgi:BioD-like phosphotransacetylase family protein